MFDVGYERLEELFARTPTLRERLLHPVEAPASWPRPAASGRIRRPR